MQFRLILSACLVACLWSSPHAGAAPPPRWDARTIDLLSRIPIQNQGRVKPLSTFAIFELVKLNGRMHCTSPEGVRVPAMHWMLDCLFYPEIARQYEVILIENPEVMQELHLDDTKKRARFSPADLEPHADHLLALARDFSGIDEKQRTMFQNQILNLYDAYATCQSLMHAMDFARMHEVVPAGSPLAGMFAAIGIKPAMAGGDYHFHYSELLARLPQLLTIYQTLQQELEPKQADGSPMAQLLMRLQHAAGNSTALSIIPPVTDLSEPTWYSPGSLLERQLHGPRASGRELEAVAALERLYDAVAQPADVDGAAATLVARIRAAAFERGEYSRVPLEISFYKIRYFYWSLVLFVLASIVVAISWMAPHSRWLGRAAVGAVLLPFLLLIAGIVVRCIIRGRPPVTTLYETTLFIPAVAIAVALVGEWITRRRIALSVAAALGCLGMFLAHNYELQGTDTMQSMIAVLNSNFWLSTHVTTVNMGYAAGLLACAIGHVTIFGRALGLGRDRPDFYRTVTRLTYGVVCFGALFAFLGTVLGGIWANNSWGRFWGWDPKENGALLIILWFLFILHARMGGFIREVGLAASAVIGGIIVTFSYWGVNLLGIGLHSYGFISGVQRILHTYWGIELGVLAVAAVAFFRMRAQASAQRAFRVKARAAEKTPLSPEPSFSKRESHVQPGT